MFQSLLLWFMPIYCLILTADDCIEDYNIGLKNVIITKIGKNSLVATGLFVIIHELCSIVFLIVFGNMKILVSHKWIQGILFQILATSIYYFFAYLLYESVATKLGQNVSVIITVILSAIEYYCAFKFFENSWMPIDDLPLMANLCIGVYSESQCIAALLRLSVMALLMLLVFFEIKNREDFLTHEKR